ncbi:MAG: Rpn family recombination-promoting nuclease/putative transposase [Pseudomonadota bacterium]
MSKEITRHNDIFSKIMGDREVARDFAKAYLPNHIKKYVNFDTLKLSRLNTEAVSDDLKKRNISDVLFELEFKGDPALLLFHVEHQSTLDDLTLLRTIQYGATALIDYKRIHKREAIPPIISIIYYHGKTLSNRHATNIDDLPIDERFKSYLFNPIFVDLSQRSDEELARHGQMSGLDLLFKHVFDEPTKILLDKLFRYLRRNSSEIQYYALKYILDRFDINKDLLLEEALKYLDQEEVMTAAQQLREQGMQQGMQQGIQQCRIGIARDMLAANESIEKIAYYTRLSVDEVKKLK